MSNCTNTVVHFDGERQFIFTFAGKFTQNLCFCRLAVLSFNLPNKCAFTMGKTYGLNSRNNNIVLA